MTNEKLILETLANLTGHISHLMLNQSALALLVGNRISTLKSDEKERMTDVSVTLGGLAMKISKEERILRKVVEDHKKALEAVQDLKTGQN